MKSNGGAFSWRVTRVLFALGSMAVASGITQLVLGKPDAYAWLFILVGVGLLAFSTRGPWDSETSGRNRSVFGFRARSETDLGSRQP